MAEQTKSTPTQNNQAINQSTLMSVTITLPAEFDQAIRVVALDAVNQAVEALAAKYGFDADEATRELNLDLKLQHKRGPKTEKSVAKKAAASDKPKRAKTGYLMFQDDVRDEVRAELELELEEGTKLQSKTVIAAGAVLWQALEKEEKEAWNDLAKTMAAPDESSS